MTRAVAVIIQVVSPLSTLGAVAAAGAAAGAVAAGASVAAAGLSCARCAAPEASECARAMRARNFFMCVSLERLRIGLAGADADDFFEFEHENLAVADLAGVGRLLDRLDGALEQVGVHRAGCLH